MDLSSPQTVLVTRFDLRIVLAIASGFRAGSRQKTVSRERADRGRVDARRREEPCLPQPRGSRCPGVAGRLGFEEGVKTLLVSVARVDGPRHNPRDPSTQGFEAITDDWLRFFG